MPVPIELRPFFTNLIEKSKRSEINWEANGGSDAYRVRFADFAIGIYQDQRKHSVRIQLLNDRGDPTAVINVEKEDDDWIGAVSLINSADLKVRKVGRTLGLAMEELGKQGLIGLEPDES